MHPRPVAILFPLGECPKTTADELDLWRVVLPDGVRLGARWCCWRYEWDPTRGAWVKVPLDPLVPGRYARANDARSWADLPDAVIFRRRFAADGLLRCLVDGEGLVAIDLDDVRDPQTGELNALARSTLADLPGCYTEISPSGCGLHLFVPGAFPEAGRQGRRRGQVEVYSGGRFMSVTGRVVRRGR